MTASRLTVVFDLDDTLLDGDSMSMWMLDHIRKSAWRIVLAVVGFPFALPLTLYAPTRRIGGSVFLWVASVGMNEMELRKSFARFASRAGAGVGVTWRRDGITQLEKHIERRDTVLIATAAPAWLAESLSETLPFRVAVVGSSLSCFVGGWVADDHCRNQAKCDAIIRAGYGKPWAAAYSDSADDGPLLAQATRAFIINASTRTTRRLAKLRISVEHVAW